MFMHFSFMCAGMKEGVMKGDDGESKSSSSSSVLVAETMLIFSLLPMISCIALTEMI